MKKDEKEFKFIVIKAPRWLRPLLRPFVKGNNED